MRMPKLYTREEARRRPVKYQVFAGMFDFLAIVAGILVIIGCIILLSSLVRWVVADVPVTFQKIWEIVTKADHHTRIAGGACAPRRQSPTPRRRTLRIGRNYSGWR